MSILNRRRFVIGSASAVLALNPATARSATESASPARYAAALRQADGTYAVGLLDETGVLLTTHALPARGHGFAFHPATQKAVVFARRPGAFALQFDAKNQAPPALFASPTDRHFYGHGAFSPDGQLLFATENHFDAAAGKIGIYRLGQQVKRIGEFPSYGIGPHDIYYDAWRGLLCVANGGIETHPDFGRAKLNLDRMQSNISFVDPANGHLVEQFHVPGRIQRLSLRHMATDQRRRTWLAGQFEGSASADTPLLATVSPEEGLGFPDSLVTATLSMRGYIGSLQSNDDGSRLAVSSPIGHSMMVIDTATDRVVGTYPRTEVCGLGSQDGTFIASSFDGKFGNNEHDVHWDNHIGSVSF